MGLLSSVAEMAGRAVSSFSKAQVVGSDSVTQSGRYDGGVSLLADPLLWAYGGIKYKEKPSNVSYNVLRYLAQRDTILATIILTRLRQVKQFGVVRTHEESERTSSTGFRVKLREGAGARTRNTTKREDELNMFVTRCGREDVDRREKSFRDWLWKFTKDRLEFDQAACEKRRSRKGELIEFFAVDGGTIRIVDPTTTSEDISYAQVYQNRVVATYEAKEMMFCPENVSTSIYTSGYAMSETEIALKKIMAHLGIEETNYRQFQPGSMPKGILQMVNADMSEENQQALSAHFQNQVTRQFRGKHRVPFIPIPRGGELKWVALPQAHDLEYGVFLDYLVSVTTALYGMDPAEINFPNRSGGIAGATPSMIQSSPEATRLTASRDKGLRTLLSYLEECINYHIILDLEPSGDFEFSFIGFDRQTDDQRLTHDKQKSEFLMTVDELREAHGMEPLEDDKGDVILNQVYLQHMQQAAQGEEGMVEGEQPEEGWEAGEEAEKGDLF
jgi:hypothetical protein